MSLNPKDRYKTGARNRAIAAVVNAGKTIEQAAAMHGLKPEFVRMILRMEKHLREVSQDPVYKALREGGSGTDEEPAT